MILGSCHCGAVRLEIARKPRRLTSCNCSICRRYGALWAYYSRRSVRVRAARGALEGYSWQHKMIKFMRCARCGCVTHWDNARPGPRQRLGVNARMFPPELQASLRIRRLDGASSWKFLD